MGVAELSLSLLCRSRRERGDGSQEEMQLLLASALPCGEMTPSCHQRAGELSVRGWILPPLSVFLWTPDGLDSLQFLWWSCPRQDLSEGRCGLGRITHWEALGIRGFHVGTEWRDTNLLMQAVLHPSARSEREARESGSGGLLRGAHL